MKKRSQFTIIFWRDAGFSYKKTLPKDRPGLQVTFGVVVNETEDFVNLATNLDYDETGEKSSEVVDGFLIPKNVIVKREDITYEK
ncbi:MAG TPA: hypothetical protein VFM02_02110 [Candidatus Paceibacterota bacterium]|nr:hypothetical protein [Candidatus Paceibacterota bacterium]